MRRRRRARRSSKAKALAEWRREHRKKNKSTPVAGLDSMNGVSSQDSKRTHRQAMEQRAVVHNIHVPQWEEYTQHLLSIQGIEDTST